MKVFKKLTTLLFIAFLFLRNFSLSYADNLNNHSILNIKNNLNQHITIEIGEVNSFKRWLNTPDSYSLDPGESLTKKITSDKNYCIHSKNNNPDHSNFDLNKITSNSFLPQMLTYGSSLLLTHKLTKIIKDKIIEHIPEISNLAKNYTKENLNFVHNYLLEKKDITSDKQNKSFLHLMIEISELLLKEENFNNTNYLGVDIVSVMIQKIMIHMSLLTLDNATSPKQTIFIFQNKNLMNILYSFGFIYAQEAFFTSYLSNPLESLTPNQLIKFSSILVSGTILSKYLFKNKNSSNFYFKTYSSFNDNEVDTHEITIESDPQNRIIFTKYLH